MEAPFSRNFSKSTFRQSTAHCLFLIYRTVEKLKHWFFIAGLVLLSVEGTSQGYNFIGDSYEIGGDCYILTPEGLFQNGAIWYNQSIDLNDPFTLQYTANFGPNDDGADGMVFVLQQVGNEILGEPGGGIGFSGFQPSLGIEFDTYQNFENADPVFDHLSVLRNGNVNHGSTDNLAGPVTISSSDFNIEDGEDHVIEIDWNPTANALTVSVDCQARISLVVDLLGQVFVDSPIVFWGFTGATGGQFNQQSICLDPYILGLPETFETCEGQPVQLEAPPATFGTFSWEPAEYLDDPTSNAPTATVNENTEFTLSYEDLCGDIQTETTTVIINEPSIDLGEDLLVCGDGVATLLADGDFEEITWSDGSDLPELEITASGIYWATASIGACSVSDTVEVELATAPNYDGPLFLTLCEGEEYTFELDQPQTQITWFDGDDAPSRSFTETGSYGFDLILGECTSSFELELSFLPLPSVELDDDISVCGEQDIALSATGNFDLIEWSDGSDQEDLTVNQSGTYWVEVTSDGCSSADTIEVAILDAPEYNQPTSVDLCDGESFLFELDQAQTDITWFDGDDSDTRTFDESGIYPFELSLGECSASFELELTFFAIPVFDLGPDVSVCEEESALFETGLTDATVTWSSGQTGTSIEVEEEGVYLATAEENGCTYEDSVALILVALPELTLSGVEGLCPGESGELFAQAEQSVVWQDGRTDNFITIDEPGIYSAQTAGAEGCTASASILVQAFDLPRISLEERQVKCVDRPLTIRADSDDNANLVWNDGTSGSFFTVQEEGVYYVELTNECGTTRREVLVEEEFCFEHVYLPNAFTPDGDGLNDLFKPVLEGVEDYDFRVFNRKGEEVFFSTDPAQGWNGSFQNNSYFCPAGVYTWRLKVDFTLSEPEVKFGSVVLVR